MTTKTNKQLLNALKKANKSRREAMAFRAGYSSAEAYKQHLMAEDKGTKAKKKTTSKETVHTVNLLDVSSSMNEYGKITHALAGLNKEVLKLKEDDNVNYVFSLITFSWNYEINTIISRKPIKQVEKISVSAYGNTALNQALGETLENLKKSVKSERILVNVFTDGEENGSTGIYKSPAALSRLIEECTKLGMTITFVGTDKDTKRVIKDLKIDASNTLVHDNTSRGVEMAFFSKMSATTSYSASVARGVSKDELTTGFYSKKTGKL